MLKLSVDISIYALVTLCNSLKVIEIFRNLSVLWGILCKKHNLNTNASVGFIMGKNTTLGLLIKYVEDKTQGLWKASFSFVRPSVRARETNLMPLELFSYKTL
jgi:hypothetical protein